MAGEEGVRVSRRQFLNAGGMTILAATPIIAATAGQSAPVPSAGSLTDIGGVRVGHFTDTRRPTGCTAILFDNPATAGVDYDGSAPGESLGVMLQPVSPLDHIHGVLLAGGGPMGLGATAGVVRFLEERRVGYDWGVPNVRVPIVVGAVIDDLAIGDGRIRVGPDEAHRACEAATNGAVTEGSVGAGAGATVGKMFVARGMPGMKGGIGTASARLGDVVIASLVVVNSAGDILDWRHGTIVAGARTADGRGFAQSADVLRHDLGVAPAANAPLADDPLRATLLAVVGTNVTLTKLQLTKLAMMANTGAARAINPYHTQGDGDQIIAVSTGLSNVSVSLTALGAIAAEVLADAIVRAVRTATGVAGWTAVRDL
ncbi:MAG: peptidase S58 [Acidobacteria bacterium]|nr:MAG: peptidase S58 [Acidobacteriota bacterium]PYR42071.1 MAG: peptidase S58 [Acidobacteriota bacterium]